MVIWISKMMLMMILGATFYGSSSMLKFVKVISREEIPHRSFKWQLAGGSCHTACAPLLTHAAALVSHLVAVLLRILGNIFC